MIYGKEDHVLRQKPICVYFNDDKNKIIFIDNKDDPVYDLKREDTQNIKSLQVKEYSQIEINSFKSSKIYQKAIKNL